jgi:hypothetical protein
MVSKRKYFWKVEIIQFVDHYSATFCHKQMYDSSKSEQCITTETALNTIKCLIDHIYFSLSALFSWFLFKNFHSNLGIIKSVQLFPSFCFVLSKRYFYSATL